MGMVEVGGLRIAYERAGVGAALVLLHGYVGDGPTTWRRQIEGPLTSSRWWPGTCRARAVVRSPEGPARPATPSAWPDPSMRSVSIDRMSSGCRSAASWRSRCTTGIRCRGGAHPGVRLRRLGRFPPADVAEAAPPTGGRARRPPAGRVRRRAASDDVRPGDAAGHGREFRESRRAFHPSGFRAMARASAENLRPALPRVDVPTLLVYGDKDVSAAPRRRGTPRRDRREPPSSSCRGGPRLQHRGAGSVQRGRPDVPALDVVT